MQYNFLNIFTDKKDLLKQDNYPINKFLLENNLAQVEKIYDFYANNSKLLYVNGFLGTGKAEIINYSLSFLSSEAIVLKYDCFNSTILDDILLSFFYEFKKLSAQNLIQEPKVKTENFSQKINSYFNSVEKPFVIIIDSFESILKENRQEILDFIKHLASFSKVKIIFIARTFEGEYFDNSGIILDRVSMYALDKGLFDKLIRDEKVKVGSLIVDEFYKLTRGYYFYTMISLKIMENTQKTLVDFLQDFRSTFSSFDEYLQKKAIELVPATSRNLFWFLAMIRHPVSEKLLKILNLYDEDKLIQLENCMILNKKNSCFFVKDYYNEQIDLLVAPNIANKIRQYIVELYQTQLPLKPIERNLLISRQTMRREIEYHSLFLPKKPKFMESQEIDINYLSYAKGLEFEYSASQSDKKSEQTTAKPSLQGDVSKVKNVSIDVSNYTGAKKEQEVSSYSSTPKITQPVSVPEKNEPLNDVSISIDSLIELAQNAHDKYLYAQEIEIYHKVLEKLNSSPFDEKQCAISENLANAYQLISDYDNSIKFYKKALSFYEAKQNIQKLNNLKLKLAFVFTQSYKNNQAQEILLSIVSSTDRPKTLIQAYMLLANIEEGLSNQKNAFEYYKSAIKIIDDSIPNQTLSELYFKLALALDDINSQKEAIAYYEKSVQTDSNPSSNKFLSSAFSNLANLYLEKSEIELASNYYKKALENDEKTGNLEGVYYASSKIASILQRRSPLDALTYFEKALEYAKKLGDLFYIASSSLAIGDYYYNSKKDELALEYYVSTLNLVKDKFSKDNISKIQIMINDIKFRMGDNAFEIAMNKLKGSN